MQTMGVMITSKIKDCSSRIKESSTSNKVNGNNKMTNSGYNYNKWAPLQQKWLVLNLQHKVCNDNDIVLTNNINEINFNLGGIMTMIIKIIITVMMRVGEAVQGVVSLPCRAGQTQSKLLLLALTGWH